MAIKENPFLKKEQSIMDKLVDAHLEFIELDRKHPSELSEWIYALHQLQSILGNRVLQRDYPNYFYNNNN